MVSGKEIKEKYDLWLKHQQGICPECGNQNPKNAVFCQECGTNLKQVRGPKKPVNKQASPEKKIKEWWIKQNSGVKIISIAGVCCIGLLLIIAVAGLLTPDKNLTELQLKNVTSDGAGEAYTYVSSNATEYEINGSTEANATVTVSSDVLNKKNESVPIDANNKFSYKINIPSNVSEFKVKFDASKTGKNDSYIILTVKKQEAPKPQTTTSQTPAELNNDSVKSIIGGGSDIRSINVQNGAVTINYNLDAIWDEDAAVRQTSEDAIDYMKKLFQDSRVNSVTVTSYSTFTDKYGKDHDEMVVKITINKDTANKIDWDGVKDLIYTDKGHLLKISDSYSINPSVYNELTFYVPISK